MYVTSAKTDFIDVIDRRCCVTRVCDIKRNWFPCWNWLSLFYTYFWHQQKLTLALELSVALYTCITCVYIWLTSAETDFNVWTERYCCILIYINKLTSAETDFIARLLSVAVVRRPWSWKFRWDTFFLFLFLSVSDFSFHDIEEQVQCWWPEFQLPPESKSGT